MFVTRILAACAAIVIVGTTWYAISFYREHRTHIHIGAERIVRALALPFHLARLAEEAPVTELPVPVHGVLLREISDTWGEARSEGRTHEGVDIFADRGTPVFSATHGYVVRTNVGSRGGNNVMVMGPGGFLYYYAHLDRIAFGIEYGVPVSVDTVLGYVGNTGNATGTPPHLHFGIYHARWDATNPFPFLVERAE